MTKPDLPGPDDSWKPKALREAESGLAATLSSADELAREMDQIEIPERDSTAKPDDVAAIKAAAERPDAPEELRLLKRKVDAGSLTWQDVLEGRAYADPEVRAALAPKLGELREVYQEFEEGHTLDEVLEARGAADPIDGVGGAPQVAPCPTATPHADDFFDNGPLAGDDTPPRTPPSPSGAAPAEPPEQAEPPAWPSRPPAEPDHDEFFADPLTESDPPRDEPRPPDRRPRDKGPDEDDYFDGSPFDR